MTHDQLSLGAFVSWSWRPLPSCLEQHLKPRDRELLRHTELWSNLEDYRAASSIDEALAFRGAIYERLPQELEKIKSDLPNHDLVMGELVTNRLACLLIRAYVHTRLRHYRYASGLVSRIVLTEEAASLQVEAKSTLASLVEGLVVLLPPDIGYEFGTRALSHHVIRSEPKLSLLVLAAKTCTLIARKSAQDALSCIGEVRHQNERISDREIESACHFLEAQCRRLLDQPAEEFDAYRRWRLSLGIGVGRAAADARAASRLVREEAMLAGGRRLHELADAAGDTATAAALAGDLRAFGYAVSPEATSSISDIASDAGESVKHWQLFTYTPSVGRPIRKGVIEMMSSRKERLAFIAIEPSFPTSHVTPFRKSAGEESFAEKFSRAIEKELDAIKDSRTRVMLLPGRDEQNNYWIICQRRSERVSLGIRVSDLGDTFKLQAVPVLELPEGLPDEGWLRKAEEDVAVVSHRSNVWQGDMDLTIERAARRMTPSLAPLEISHGVIRELE